MEKEEIYKKILDILEKKNNNNSEYKIQKNVFVGGANLSTEEKIHKLTNGIGNSIDIKVAAKMSFDRISKHMK